MNITRIIHPIGQGGFYTETLSDGEKVVNIVYDCGGFGNGGQKKMNNYLDSYLTTIDGNKKEIEAVFISHFHADHVNGLQYLLENANVKYLFIPQLTEDVLIEAIVYNFSTIGMDNSTNRYLVDLYKRINNSNVEDNKKREETKDKSTRIIQIPENTGNLSTEISPNNIPDNNDLSLQAWNPQNNNKNIDLCSENIPSGSILYCWKWLYIPFNPMYKTNTLKEELKKEFNKEITIETLPQLLQQKKAVKKCKDIYRNVFGSQHNSYSMTLFSGIIDDHLFSASKNSTQFLEITYYSKNNTNKHLKEYNNANFLYTGDFEPKNNINDLKNFYNISFIWDNVSSIQAPHHGSILNYHDDLYTNRIRGLISVGNNNVYLHPDSETITKIANQGCLPIMVTEDKSSMKIYQYKIIYLI